MKFKVGQRVKGEYGTGVITCISDDRINSQNYCVKHDNFKNGHDGVSSNDILEGNNENCGLSGWFYRENELELTTPTTDEELLAYAKENYTIGTVFKSTWDDKGKVRTVKPFEGKTFVSFYMSRDNKTGKTCVRFNDGINSSDGGCSNPLIWIDGVWAEIIKTEKENNMKNQSVTRQDLQTLYNAACSTWKANITNYANRISPFENSLELTTEEIIAIFKAATSSQKEVLKSVGLVEPVPENTFDLSMLEGKQLATTNSGSMVWIGDNVASDQGLRRKCFGLSPDYDWELGMSDIGNCQILIPRPKKQQ